MNHLGEVFPGSREDLHQLLWQQNYAYVGTIRKIKLILSECTVCTRRVEKLHLKELDE